MEISKQESFRKLRPSCVELSSVGLRFRGHQTTSNDVLRALQPVYSTVEELGTKNALDEKLAEYVFFPLSHVFNETRRVSARCLEVAVDCLRILIAKGWRQRLSPAMGKQLMILMTLIVGGASSLDFASQQVKPQPEELDIAGFRCLTAIFSVLEGPVAERSIYNEVGTATIVDQLVYILLEGIADSRSVDVCVAAAESLHALFVRVTDRVVLASVMPRTVSALTKTLKPTTQKRRSYRLLETCLRILTRLLKVVLNDRDAFSSGKKPAQSSQSSDKLVLDDSWMKATATQIRLALANVVQIRRHERPEVQEALLELCTMIIEDCQTTLKESIPIIVETITVLSEIDEYQIPNHSYSTLKHLAIAYPVVVDTLKDSLYNWTTSFPRTMQGNDETAKQWGIKQISTTFQILSQLQSGSEILTTNLASGLCDSVAAAINKGPSGLQSLGAPGDGSGLSTEVLNQESGSLSFPPVLLEHRSQRQTLGDLRSMIGRLNLSESGIEITRSLVNRVHGASGASILAPFWLTLTFLNQPSQAVASVDDFISFDDTELSTSPSRAGMIEELYYLSLPILNELPFETSSDWRVSALALETVALQAKQLGESFRPELMDALYPTLQLLASANPNLQRHAMICLNTLTMACNYRDAGTMIIENADYLVNSLALKLNTFDVSPYPPQVLLMMVRLCGASLIPYLDDLIDSIFGILDMYHGYPKLVEIMFRALAAIVEEGAKKPSLLAITSGKEGAFVNHRKRQYEVLPISTLARSLADRKTKRVRYTEEEAEVTSERIPHPRRPWAETEPKEKPEDIDLNPEDLEKGESDEPLPPPREPEDEEKPLSKSHTLLLHIVKSVPLHLASPSPYLRRSLLSIFIQIVPVLAQNENSFLPLINDLWPSVTSKVNFPSSLVNEPSPTGRMTREISTDRAQPEGNDFDYREETFVVLAACNAVESMCKYAGDFMASRVETEYPRWERLYNRAWEKVSQDADKAIERRAHHQRRKANSSEPETGRQSGGPRSGPDLLLGLGLSQSALTTTAGAIPGSARPFTPHHSLWRALTSLFITLLTHVRLPLSVGDQICEFLGAWITRFAGPDYYHQQTRGKDPAAGGGGGGGGGGVGGASNSPDPGMDELRTVEGAIRAMETWNADLTWFVFQLERKRVYEIMKGPDSTTTTTFAPKVSEVVDQPFWERGRPRDVKFAEVVF